MKVRWVCTDHEPECNKYGISMQLVILTNLGNFNTGYFNTEKKQWEIEGLLQHKEFVVAWLEGLGTNV